MGSLTEVHGLLVVTVCPATQETKPAGLSRHDGRSPSGVQVCAPSFAREPVPEQHQRGNLLVNGDESHPRYQERHGRIFPTAVPASLSRCAGRVMS